jgi:putative spermidine/putrescine transport system permease protein
LLRVHLPVLLKGIFPVVSLYTIFFMGAYEIPLILGQSSPQMFTILILEKLQRYSLSDIPDAYAMALFYAIIYIGTLSWLMMQYKKRWN